MTAKFTPWRYISRNVDEKANWASRIPFAIEFAPEHGSCVAPIADIVANPLVEVCDQPQAEANARLIAAAPELLAVCEKIKAHGTISASWIDDLNAAISKAKGE